MVIEIQSPDVEAVIRERMKSGGFHDAEDVVRQALWQTKEMPSHTSTLQPPPASPRKSLAQLFAESPFKGLDIDFEREQDYGRDVIL